MTKQTLRRSELVQAAGWLSRDEALASDVREALALQRMIAYETGIVPLKCHMEGQGRIIDKTVVVTVAESELEPELLREPQELFPERRTATITANQFENLLGDLLAHHYRVEVAHGA